MEFLGPAEIIRRAERLRVEIKQMREASQFRIAKNDNDEEAKMMLEGCDKGIADLDNIIKRAAELEAAELKKSLRTSSTGVLGDRIFRQLGGKQ